MLGRASLETPEFCAGIRFPTMKMTLIASDLALERHRAGDPDDHDGSVS